jgi:hypothetical protein
MRSGLLAICAVLAIAGAAQAQSTVQSTQQSQVTLAPNAVGGRPDPGALSQCFINCSAQQLTCKQSCAIH